MAVFKKGDSIKLFKETFCSQDFLLIFHNKKNLDQLFSFSKRKPYHQKRNFWGIWETDSMWTKSSV